MTRNQKKEMARRLYFEFIPLTEISDQSQVNINTLKNWVYGLRRGEEASNWKTERDTAVMDASAVSDKHLTIKTPVITALSLTIIENGLQAILSKGANTAHDIKVAVDVLLSLKKSKLIFYETDKATSISEVKSSITKERLAQAIASDYFLEI